jgi:TPR repeat protein
MYLQGAGLPADEIEALAWFMVAALAGNREAATRQTAGEFRLSPAAILAAQQRSRVISEQITARKKTSGTSRTVSPR